MMTLSRLQSGTEYMEITRVDVNELVQDIASAYSSTLADKGVNLVLDCPRPVPDAMTDPDRIEQVLVILLDNASRYTPKGGTITISARNAKEKIQLSVTDTGCGIPESDLPHIFERFYKVDKSHSEGGTGLGLSIAQFIMEKLGETISVESEVGKGTRFTLTLQRYVRNAIALGPAGEKHTRYGDDDEKDEYVPNDADIQEDDDVVDAHGLGDTIADRHVRVKARGRVLKDHLASGLQHLFMLFEFLFVADIYIFIPDFSLSRLIYIHQTSGNCGLS